MGPFVVVRQNSCYYHYLLQGIRSPKAYLVITNPEVNIEEFWRSVYASNSQAIVMLDGISVVLEHLISEKYVTINYFKSNLRYKI